MTGAVGEWPLSEIEAMARSLIDAQAERFAGPVEVDEFAGRHNARQMDTADQMGAMVHGAHGKRMRYADLTAS